MISAIQIVAFLNQPFLHSKLMKQLYFFPCWYKFIKIKSWLKRFWWGMVKSECGRSGLWTLELTDGTNWFFTCWYSFTPIKRWLKICGASMVKNGCSQFGDGTLKLTVCEEWIDGIHKLICMLIHDHRNWKLIKKFFGWALSKMGVASLVTELKNERTE